MLVIWLVLPASLLASSEAAAQGADAGKVQEYKGKVIAAREAEIAPRIDALLDEIHFTPGQIIKKGDLLFAFSARFKQLALTAAQARQKLMQAQLDLAEVRLKNAQSLRARDVSSEMQLLETQAQRDIAAANAEEAVANVHIAELQLEQTRLYAPIDGLIGRPFVKEGTFITLEARDQTRLANIVQLNPIQVVGKVPFETYLQRREMFSDREKGAEKLEFTLLLPNGEKYAHVGRLVAGTGEFDPATQVMAIAVEFDNPEYLLRPGLDVTMQSIVREK
jgi:membrane fusion protein (multidrug efflux system)